MSPIPWLEEVQRAIVKLAGRYVPFAQHGGTRAKRIAKGLVGKGQCQYSIPRDRRGISPIGEKPRSDLPGQEIGGRRFECTCQPPSISEAAVRKPRVRHLTVFWGTAGGAGARIFCPGAC